MLNVVFFVVSRVIRLRNCIIIINFDIYEIITVTVFHLKQDDNFLI